eukprot:Hpha_TRINITY_DN14726_c0_g1::TRINITY_DN14726_c0_g1_i1::g.102862::m.102862
MVYVFQPQQQLIPQNPAAPVSAVIAPPHAGTSIFAPQEQQFPQAVATAVPAHGAAQAMGIHVVYPGQQYPHLPQQYPSPQLLSPAAMPPPPAAQVAPTSGMVYSQLPGQVVMPTFHPGWVPAPVAVPVEEHEDEVPVAAALAPAVSAPAGEGKRGTLPESPKCRHNKWHELRTRRGNRVLRCAVCASKWQLNKWQLSEKYKVCSDNDQGGCPLGDACPRLHIVFSYVPPPFRKALPIEAGYPDARSTD